MKKIININFHSRVIPIEETAYEILQQYVESLRRYFANEEGREEIISDIENRFSELFADKLKKGAACITDDDVNAIIASMGRPEEFAGEEPETSHASSATGAGSGTSATGSGTASGTGATGSGPQQGYGPYTADEPRRLFRASNDKVLGGVCAGLANYLKLDPAIVRLLFVLITFTWGFGFLLYIILWIVLPTKALATNARKRLYRNPDDRVIAGVASGIAAYFHIDVWIPRLIFSLPLIIGIVTSIFQNIWWHFFRWDGGHILADGFGGSLFIAYIVLWIVLPEAITASEKLEMRGEKIDLESIKNTVKSDLESFKGRARDMGAEMKESFQNMGQQMGSQIRQNVQNFSAEAGAAARKSNSGIGHAIGVVFKAFFLMIAGIVAFALVMLLVALAFSGGGLLDLKSYVLDGFWEDILAWASFILCLVVPVIALLTWLIRRITGIRSQRHYLGYMFATLWVIGLISFVVLAGMVINNFRVRAHSEEDFALAQPSHGNLIIRARTNVHREYYDDDWWFNNGWRHHGYFYTLNDDSVFLNTVQIKILRSDDSSYHMRILRGSLGPGTNAALDHARQINFQIAQTDSIVLLPGGFPVTRDQKFRNQQVIVAVYIPNGKKFMIDNSVNRYDWMNLRVGRSHIEFDDHDRNDDSYDDEGFSLENNFYWNSGVQYMMTTEGLQRVNAMGKPEDRPERPEIKERPEKPDRPGKKENDEKPENPTPGNGGYRYKEPAKKNNADTPATRSSTMLMSHRPSRFVLFSLFI
ncbi:MAG TPA: PspC domain-containing protein [Puia sp.]|jgi:phage shock protein PspC (stress-responsive transcriptional regulator)|nr:PspC domain-containing protein [Puia sp.]